jgi:hypothetical protein
VVIAVIGELEDGPKQDALDAERIVVFASKPPTTGASQHV